MRFADRLDVECERKVKDNSKVFDLTERERETEREQL